MREILTSLEKAIEEPVSSGDQQVMHSKVKESEAALMREVKVRGQSVYHTSGTSGFSKARRKVLEGPEGWGVWSDWELC